MTRRYVVILLVALASVTAVAAQSAPANDFASVAARLERAVLGDDAAGVRQARADLLRILAAGPSPQDAPLVHYAIAYAGWRLSTNPSVPAKEREALLDDAEKQLKRATEIDGAFAEGHALLSGVYGMKIANSSWRGILLGPRAGAALDRAVALDPENPRVLISKAVSKFNTPRMFGGNVAEAETLLRRAIERLGQQPSAKRFPAWGRFDAHVWLGQILAGRGDKAGARAEYAKALEVAPKSGWITYVLLPALDK